jgi:L-glyceraldehyde 3-phosphate reductase
MDTTPTFVANDDRYATMAYRRSGRSGMDLPLVSLGFWQNFGGDRPLEVQREIVRRAFDLGVTHFDIANNYGVPYGTAEENLGRLLSQDFGSYRDELIISTKAGWDMWPGPYGDHGSRKYLLASLDQSLSRLGVDYVDIFYSHRPDPSTPLAETMGALHTAVQQGKALYVGISSYGPERTLQAAAILRDLGTPLLIHQPSYSMIDRWIERGLLDVLEEVGAGCIAFSALAQGLLTSRYLEGIPSDSRAARTDTTLPPSVLTDERRRALRTLNALAAARGQSLAQLALSWALRDPRVTSVVVGASSVKQLEDNVAAIHHLDFTADELSAIDAATADAPATDLWRALADTDAATDRPETQD